ncbi:MAG: polyprenyl synthetase family protein [Alphaproteobacteria bacterium]|nr:polyprenyl synthetase family protein [Alphaproteobacteria bacterium]
MFTDQLNADAAAVEAELAARFDALRKGAAPRLAAAMSYAAMAGGKRLRAALVLGASRLAAGGDCGGAINVAAAFECLHAYSLIHDDLPAMDDAETRRGKPSCHLEFDEATAILAGDALQTMAFELLASPDTHDDGAVRAGLVMDLATASGVAGMAGGQMLDLEAETRRFDLDETRAMQALKTGALIKASAVAGGRVGGGGDDLLAALANYADRIGLAFQIADDLLDRTSDAAAMGKPTGRDDEAGKASFVDHLGIDAAQKEAERLIDEANAMLTTTAGSSAPHLDYMLEISSFIIRRDH